MCDYNSRVAEITAYNRKQSSTIWGNRQHEIITADSDNLRHHGVAACEVLIAYGLEQQICEYNH